MAAVAEAVATGSEGLVAVVVAARAVLVAAEATAEAVAEAAEFANPILAAGGGGARGVGSR